MVKLNSTSFRRTTERGAALFVVVLAITLLTAVGMFAAHSATLVDQAAGYNRLARQTQQMAEYGTLAVAADFGSGAAGTYLNEARTAVPPKICVANAGRAADCFRRTYEDVAKQTLIAAKETLLADDTGDVPDVIGASSGTGSTAGAGDITGRFETEITDISGAGLSVKGRDIGNPNASAYKRITATTYSQLRPVEAVSCTADLSGAGASVTGQQAMRAHLIVGPL